MGEDRSTNANADGPIRVLLADDHTMFRQGLAGVLASYAGMEVVAEVPNDADALEIARELSPDVVIMQVQLPFSRACYEPGLRMPAACWRKRQANATK